MFRLLGFEVRIRPGFVVFVALIAFIYQNAFGLWLAGSLTVFTLLHELGHAVAARSAGADASISLDFLAGYTSFRPAPGRPITRGRRALISAAGPFTQIAVSVAVLLAMGVDPTSRDSALQSMQAYAVWWAGPVIGLLNLIPVLPLDGGHLALTAIEKPLGKRAVKTMAIASIVVTGGGAAWMFVTGRDGFAIFVVFLLLNQVQILQATSRRGRPDAGVDGETVAWQTGRPGMLEPGQRLSPWYQAHRALGDRRPDLAADLIVDDLASSTPGRWRLPPTAPRQQLRAILDVVPSDLPIGNEHSALIFVDVCFRTGEVRRGGEHAARTFERHRSSPFALMVARASAALGDDDIALQWLDAALHTADEEPPAARGAIAKVMDAAPEFERLRQTDRFRALRIAL